MITEQCNELIMVYCDLTVSHYHLFFCIVLVALQFPEGLLMFACTIADILERCIVWLTIKS